MSLVRKLSAYHFCNNNTSVVITDHPVLPVSYCMYLWLLVGQGERRWWPKGTPEALPRLPCPLCATVERHPEYGVELGGTAQLACGLFLGLKNYFLLAWNLNNIVQLQGTRTGSTNNNNKAQSVDYRVTIHLVQNLMLTSKLKFHFSLARAGQAKTELLFWSQPEVLHMLNGLPVAK